MTCDWLVPGHRCGDGARSTFRIRGAAATLRDHHAVVVRMKSVQRGSGGIIIRIDDEAYRFLSRKRGPGRSFNDVLRRMFGLARRVKWNRRLS